MLKWYRMFLSLRITSVEKEYNQKIDVLEAKLKILEKKHTNDIPNKIFEGALIYFFSGRRPTAPQFSNNSNLLCTMKFNENL